MGLIWKDINNKSVDIISIGKLNGKTIMKIIESKDGYYAKFFDERMFKTEFLSYYTASKKAKSEFGMDTIKNRLEVAKNYFIDYYRSRHKEIMEVLEERRI